MTYNATLNKDAVIDGDGNANEVKLSYGNHQNTVPSKVTTKSYQFDLVKVDGTTNKLLDGAEFELADGETKLSFVKDTAGNYRVATTGDETVQPLPSPSRTARSTFTVWQAKPIP